MILIQNIPSVYNTHDKHSVALIVPRRQVQKRRWRGTAEDGTAFGFDLEAPIANGACFYETTEKIYCIRQKAETVLFVAFGRAFDPKAAAELGWQVGNLHFAAQFTDEGLVLEDDPALEQLFDRLYVAYERREAVLELGTQPHRHT